ncbi:hypothetical protein B0T17DRAFT_315944 [Bombardia bombarda]|uniref:Uncharacterized protein n=1 Tax=Bombardia bombarda TaxID=252184 RepID=A0AA40BY66_9PEZI|nr:hypothetical protein B0T17DRAFT_315944 [Bombardia bombarda]
MMRMMSYDVCATAAGSIYDSKQHGVSLHHQQRHDRLRFPVARESGTAQLRFTPDVGFYFPSSFHKHPVAVLFKTKWPLHRNRKATMKQRMPISTSVHCLATPVVSIDNPLSISCTLQPVQYPYTVWDAEILSQPRNENIKEFIAPICRCAVAVEKNRVLSIPNAPKRTDFDHIANCLAHPLGMFPYLSACNQVASQLTGRPSGIPSGITSMCLCALPLLQHKSFREKRRTTDTCTEQRRRA